MTITPERRAELRSQWRSYPVIIELLDALDAAEAELSRLRELCAVAQEERDVLKRAIAPIWPTGKPISQYEELMVRYRESATKVYTAKAAAIQKAREG